MTSKSSKPKKPRSKLNQKLLQRETELAVINRVQQALAEKLDLQGIYDAVGDKIRDVFDAQVVQLVTFQPETNTIIRHYIMEKGQRYYVKPVPCGVLWSTVFLQGKTWVVDDLRGLLDEIDPQYEAPAGEMPKSALFVPLIKDGEVQGAISLANNDRKKAFGKSDVILLETIANSMNLALENARLFAETQRLLKETQQRAGELLIINSVQQGLASQLEVQAIYDLVGDEIREIFNAQVVMISTYDSQTETIEHRYAIERGKRIYAPGHHPIRGFRTQIVQTRRPVLVNENVGEIAAKLGQPTLPGTITPKSWLGVPMLVGDQVTGILSLQNIDEENAFNDSDVRLLETFAASMSIALENARLWEQENLYRKTLEREFEIGRQIQAGFLPDTLPQPKNWEIAASLVSAREVAGDFYDVFELPEDKIGIVIGDVCDKGLGAALFMTLFRSLLRAISSLELFARTENTVMHSPATRVKNAISLTNNYISEIHGDTGMFATVFFGILDPHTGTLTYINSGHLPPLIINSQGVKEVLKFSGPAVGTLADVNFFVWEATIEHGELLFAYTDGLTDTSNPSGTFFDKKGLIPLLMENQPLSNQLNKIQNQATEHAAGLKQFDDITLLAARRL